MKKYLGRKVLFTIKSDEEIQYEKEMNIITSIERLEIAKDKGYYAGIYFTDIELVKDNIELYKCDVRSSSNLEALVATNQAWNKGIFNYREYLTKEEIINALKNGCCVAVEGLGEIELEDIQKLD